MTSKTKSLARRPRTSLRTILVGWFLLFSIVPLAFVTGYSLVKYEQAINNELVQRLRSNVRELNSIFAENKKFLDLRMQRHESDTSLITHLSTNNIAPIRAMIRPSIANSPLSSIKILNREGLLVAILTPDENADNKENQNIEERGLVLNDSDKQVLDTKGRYAVINAGSDNSVDLVTMTRLQTPTGRTAGYIEETITFGKDTLERLKDRLHLEIILFDGEGNIMAGSHPDFLLYKKDFFASKIIGQDEVFFELPVRQVPYGMTVSPVSWGDQQFLVGLGASKANSKDVLREINIAFFTVMGAIIVLAIIMALVGARVVLRPLNDLLLAIQRMDQKNAPAEIPVQGYIEFGTLTESFNEMSRRVREARADLEKKIKETEHAYTELKDAQSKLVHSAKMVSLGQLVAGVAHELNNPIGFIYSNMSHLHDYSNRLLKIIETAEQNPGKLAKIKEESDYDYIIKDLPRLIQSCEDGARRVRDIVLGLRNFSRLEEAKIKKVDLTEGIQETLRLLSGELKGRVKVHTEFGKMPEVMCYASQVNQVFMNILSNAAQAIDGEGEIWVRTSHLNAGKHDKSSGHVQISIRDSGKGMPADIVDKIFDPFFTTKNVGQGTGLGLSISYGIVRKHGGEITVKSEIGRGTEFIVTLPVDGPPGADREVQAG